MNGIDIAILGILGAFLVKGALRGFLKELCTLFGLAVGGWLGYVFHASLAETLMASFDLAPKLAVVIAFSSLFLATVLFFAVVGFLLSRFVKMMMLGGFNRAAGGFFGLVQGVALLALVLFAVSLKPFPAALRPVLQQSELAPPFIRLGKYVFHGSRSYWQDRG